MSPSASDNVNRASRPLTREDVLGAPDVAALLGLPRSTVHDLARRGLLPARRVGRQWLFVRERIEAALVPLDEAGAWQPAAELLSAGATAGRPRSIVACQSRADRKSRASPR
jgi:excisionase family DNA binding protein